MRFQSETVFKFCRRSVDGKRLMRKWNLRFQIPVKYGGDQRQALYILLENPWTVTATRQFDWDHLCNQHASLYYL